MMRMQALFGILTVMLLAACAAPQQRSEPVAGGAYSQALPAAAKPARSASRMTVNDGNGSATLEKVPFRAGVSTVTVERMARQAGCQPRTGAGLLTEPGPMEVYRLQCEDGRHYLAQCELRQCRAMRR